MNNADKPINGIIRSETDSEERFIGTFTDYQNSGLTKREYASMLAMQALISNSNIKRPDKNDTVEYEKFSKVAIEYADSLLKHLENK